MYPRKFLSKGQCERMLLKVVGGETKWLILVWFKSEGRKTIKCCLFLHKKQMVLLRVDVISLCHIVPRENWSWKPSVQILESFHRNHKKMIDKISKAIVEKNSNDVSPLRSKLFFLFRKTLVVAKTVSVSAKLVVYMNDWSTSFCFFKWNLWLDQVVV